jgi:hypothetical protein
MNTVFNPRDCVDARVAGAVRFVDSVTAAPIDTRLQVTAPGASLLRNRSGLYVLHDVAGLAEYQAHFDAPPAVPAPGSVEVVLSVQDPDGRYLPRAAALSVPRNPALPPSDPASLFHPVDIPLYRASSAPLAANWAVLRAVVVAGNDDHLGGALLRVLRNGIVLARGLSDWRGEALVPVAGVPVTTFAEGDGAVVTSEIEVAVEAVFDPDTGTRTSAADVAAGRMPAMLPCVDPAAIEIKSGLPGAQQTLLIAARRTQTLSIAVDLP